MTSPEQTATLGKYRLLALLGQGGMAEVYLASAQGPAGFHKLVVLKLLRPHLAHDPDFVTMLLDEARIAARLSHPNVIQTFEVVTEGERPVIVMEYLEGQPYAKLITRARKRGRPLPLELRLKVLNDCLSGLHHAHELRNFDGRPLHLVHRDVTPQNVLVSYDGQVKLLDFGIAKAATSCAVTRTGVLKGKVSYMAPEQILGETVDRRADIYAVGVMIWEALTGMRLWKDEQDVIIMQRVVAGEVPPVHELSPDVPDDLVRICERALARDRQERYASCLELSADLEQVCEGIAGGRATRTLAREIEELFAEERAAAQATVERELGAEHMARTTQLRPADGRVKESPSTAAVRATDPRVVMAQEAQADRGFATTGATPAARATTRASRPEEGTRPPTTPARSSRPEEGTPRPVAPSRPSRREQSARPSSPTVRPVAASQPPPRRQSSLTSTVAILCAAGVGYLTVALWEGQDGDGVPSVSASTTRFAAPMTPVITVTPSTPLPLSLADRRAKPAPSASVSAAPKPTPPRPATVAAAPAETPATVVATAPSAPSAPATRTATAASSSAPRPARPRRTTPIDDVPPLPPDLVDPDLPASPR